jgi:hypothetical protein
MGLRWDDVERRRQIAEVELEKAGRLEHPLAMDYGKAAISGAGMLADDMKTQQINRQALARARAELGQNSGYGDAEGDTLASYSKSVTNELLKVLIGRIEEQNQMMKDKAKSDNRQPLPDRQPGGNPRLR